MDILMLLNQREVRIGKILVQVFVFVCFLLLLLLLLFLFFCKKKDETTIFPIWTEQTCLMRFLLYRLSRLFLSSTRETCLCPSSARKLKVQNNSFQCSRIHADQNTWNRVK